MTETHASRLQQLVNAANDLAETIEHTNRLAEQTVATLSGPGRMPMSWPSDRAPVVSLVDAARLTGRHVDVLRRWCADGRLRAIRVGRTWAIPRDVVAELAGHRGRSRPRLAKAAEDGG